MKSPKFSTFSSILSPHHRDLLDAEKSALSSLAQILKSVDVPDAEIKILQDTKAKLDDVFMLVVVGEFNSGKSTFINALLGKKVLKDGVLPTTERICILRHQQLRASTSISTDEDYEELFIEEKMLRNIALVDTPGTNGLIEKHAKLTQELIPRSDLIVFVTSGT